MLFNYISGLYFLANVFGSAIGSILLANHVYVLNGLSISCYLATICVAILVVPCYERDFAADQAVGQPTDIDERDPLIPSLPNGSLDQTHLSSEVRKFPRHRQATTNARH